MKDLSVQTRFVELRGQGWAYDRIAKELRVSRQTLINWSKDLSTEIANIRALYHEGLIETLKVQRSDRIRFLAAEFEKARLELASRSLEELPSDKLLEYQLKIMKALITETNEVPALALKKDPFDDLIPQSPFPEYETWEG